jgi:hypothetical protein
MADYRTNIHYEEMDKSGRTGFVHGLLTGIDLVGAGATRFYGIKTHGGIGELERKAGHVTFDTRKNMYKGGFVAGAKTGIVANIVGLGLPQILMTVCNAINYKALKEQQ